MEYKKIGLVLVAIALIVSGSVALLKDRKILASQYKRCALLTRTADQLFLNKKYGEAVAKYEEALKLDPTNSKLWSKILEAQRKLTIASIQSGIKATVESVPKPQAMPQSSVASPQPPTETGGAIIEEDEGC